MDTSERKGLRVIGAGMGRTGTASLKRALEQLGFAPCHHMEEVIKHGDEVPTWQAAARGEKVDWATFMGGWGASVDFPSALYYRELMEAFPDARVILSVRDASGWYESMSRTIVPMLTRFPIRVVAPWLPGVGNPGKVMRESKLGRQVLGGFSDRARMLQLFEDWNAEVKRVVPKERLLVFEAKEGWEPLCAFLGVPVPSVPYPRVNDAAAFERRVTMVTILSWVILLTPIAIALSLLAWLF